MDGWVGGWREGWMDGGWRREGGKEYRMKVSGCVVVGIMVRRMGMVALLGKGVVRQWMSEWAG